MHLGILSVGIDLDIQGHLAISTHETVLHVPNVLLFWTIRTSIR